MCLRYVLYQHRGDFNTKTAKLTTSRHLEVKYRKVYNIASHDSQLPLPLGLIVYIFSLKQCKTEWLSTCKSWLLTKYDQHQTKQYAFCSTLAQACLDKSKVAWVFYPLTFIR